MRAATLATGLALLLAPPARAATLDPRATGFESIATVDDARALSLNPAAIGLRHAGEWRLAWSEGVDARRAWAADAAGRGLAAGFTRHEGVARSYSVGFGIGDDDLRLGWAAQVLAPDGQGGPSIGDHRLGALASPQPWLRVAATAEHLFEPDWRGARRRRTHTWAVGLRPLALSRTRAHDLGPRWTLAADVSLREGESREQARVRLGAELEPVSGVVLRASAGNDRSVQLGLTLRGVRASVSSAQTRVRPPVGGSERVSESVTLSSHRSEERTVFALPSQRRIATVRVAGRLADEALGGVSLLGGDAGVPARPLHRVLERALEDPLTRGVLLELGGASGMAQLDELRPRIARLRAAGKSVVAHLPGGGGRGDLLLASAADSIVASREALFAGLGLRSERRYYRSLLDRMGVTVDRSSVGTYKSAYREYSADSMPPADREVIERTLDQVQAHFLGTFATARRLAPAQVLPVLDGREWPADDLARLGVIDRVGEREEAIALLGGLTRLGNKPRTVRLSTRPLARIAWTEPTRIAVVYAGGGIRTGRSGSDLLEGHAMGDATVIAQLERAFRDRRVRAVVLRIDSPGGSSQASRRIDMAVQRLKRETGKPLIASMAGSAASGGYSIASHADWIVAGRHTRTGSIGVYYLKPAFEGLYDKLGVRQEDATRGEYMRAWSPARRWTLADQAAADSSIHRTYERFVAQVADGRRMSLDEVREVAQGRVWLGEDALAHRLIDQLGTFEDALAEARRRGGVPQAERTRLFEQGAPRGSWLERAVGRAVRERFESFTRLPALEGMQAREAPELLSDD